MDDQGLELPMTPQDMANQFFLFKKLGRQLGDEPKLREQAYVMVLLARNTLLQTVLGNCFKICIICCSVSCKFFIISAHAAGTRARPCGSPCSDRGGIKTFSFVSWKPSFPAGANRFLDASRTCPEPVLNVSQSRLEYWAIEY